MRKIRAEMPSNPQQNDLGIESNALLGADVGRMPGLASATLAAGGPPGRIVTRAVSFFGL